MNRNILFALSCGAAGCIATVDGTSTPPDPVPEAGFGVVAQPRLGSVVVGPTGTAAITFAGVHERPEYRIDIQVLDHPVEANRWVTIASATTGDQPSPTDPTTYEWQVTAVPAQLSPGRWQQGGLLHVRALGAAGEPLAGLFHDADPCIDAAATWVERAERCGGMFASGIVVVSPAEVASGPNRPRFLDRRGAIDELETATYYQTIGAPATLAELRTRFALDPSSPSATYYNAGDLGIGREMQCGAAADGAIACAVSNYGEFGGDMRDALERSVDGNQGGGGAFATVAMVYRPPANDPNSVQFMVYGATGTLVNAARLDTVGDNQSVPNNCLNCHGSSASYDPMTHQVSGASFLPFDPATFVFSDRVGYRAFEQAPALARLNQLVAATEPTPAIRELIDGWYPHGPADTEQVSFVPAGWTATPLDREVYQHVVADHCRTCHASGATGMSFSSAESFRSQAAAIATSICTTHDMPNAQVPLQRVWAGPARAYLAAYLDVTTCDP